MMEKDSKKILFFLFGGCGGAERMTLTIAKFLPLDKFDVAFVVCGRLKEIYPFIPFGYRVIQIKWHNIYCFPRIRIANVLRKEKPDYVFSSTMGLNLLVLQVAKWFNIKTVIRNDNTIKVLSTSDIKKMKKLYPYAKYIIAQQEEMSEELISEINVCPNIVKTLYNPIDTKIIEEKAKFPNPYPRGTVNFLWVGNFRPTKGHDILTKAFKIIHSKISNSHLYFIGSFVDNPFVYKKLKQIVKEARLQDFVHFIGYQSNPYNWMNYCDCFVLPSRLEGLPNVLLEVMYLGRPVVATVCVPVIDRMIEEGYNGYKVQPEDPEAMAKAMEKALVLKDFEMTFHTASTADFIKLFC